MMITMVLVVVLINSHLKVSIYNDSDNNDDDDDYNDNTNNTNNTHHYYHYYHCTTLPLQYYSKFDLI